MSVLFESISSVIAAVRTVGVAPLAAPAFALLFAVCLGVAALFPATTEHLARSADRLLRHIGAKKATSILLAGGATLAAGALLAVFKGIPSPFVPDEFSYLLQTETFASGRAANPTHTLWHYFEAPFILHTPSYVSFYPPVAPAIMAVGAIVFGHPWFAVLAACAGAAALTVWMLQAYMPARWALVGGIVCVQMLAFSSWMVSYWGGAITACAGALIAGAVPRWLRTRKIRYGALTGLGLVMLAGLRPYEGLVFAAAVAACFTGAAVRERKRVPLAAQIRPLLACAAVLAAGFALLLGYNRATTGHWIRVSYQDGLKQYMPRRMFMFQEHRAEPNYRHAELARFYRSLRREEMSSVQRAWFKTTPALMFYTNGALVVALAFLPFVFRDRRFRVLLIVLGAMVLALALEEWVHPHYAAPATCVIVAAIVQCLRHMRAAGWRLARASVVILLALSSGATLVRGVVRWYDVPPVNKWYIQRQRIANDLARAGGKHVVIVRYARWHESTAEWVYNGPDIDSQPVVWARSMPDARPLENYFAGRKIWVVDADQPYAAPREYNRIPALGERAGFGY
jgi:hypothetical protein